MAYSIGILTGGLLIAFLMIGLIRWIFRALKVADRFVMAFVPSLVFLAVATVVGGFGFSRTGEPVFLFAFEKYLLPAVLIGALYAYLDHRRSRRPEQDAQL